MLDDAAIERYARQIVVPGIGAAGQEKLLDSTVLLVGHPRGCATAALYLRAAGVGAVSGSERPSVIVVAGASTVDDATLERLRAKQSPICWYEVTDDGLATGVHPEAAIPRMANGGADPAAEALHDAGACMAAALACAVILGLEVSKVETRLAP